MKKFLSLVLALVMTMSLVTISAGATEYKDLTDKDEIQYEEAVAVLNRIGVITGYDDGSFRPETELTRGAAAKIIVSLLIGPEAANNLPNTYAPYPDVPANHTFAGVISYCKTAGIISGYGDGTFKPANSLTGYAFAKMLLGAIGYDSAIQGYTDTGWTMNVARDGNAAGLFNRIEFDGAAAVNREQACQLALNTLKATMVEYSGGLNITAGNATVTSQPTLTYKISNQSYATNISNRKASNIGNADVNNHYTVEFGEEHFKDLRLNDEHGTKYTTSSNTNITIRNIARDDFGRPSNKWSYKKVTIGVFPIEPDFVYTEQVIHVDDEKVTDASKVRALELSGYDLVSDEDLILADQNTRLWVNGVENFAVRDKDNKIVPALAKVGDIANYTDNGTRVEIYVSEDDSDFIQDVVVVKTQLMEIKNIKSEAVSLKLYDDGSDIGKDGAIGYNSTPIDKKVNDVEVNDECYKTLSGMKEGDIVAVIPVAPNHEDEEKYDVSRVYTPETVSGELTWVDTFGTLGSDANGISVTVGGTDYKVALWNKDLIDIDGTSIRVTRKDVTLHLDEYGNALLAKNVGSTSDYMVIGGYHSGLVDGKVVTYADGWDIKGNEISLNIGNVNYDLNSIQGNTNSAVFPVGSLVHYSSSTTSKYAEWVLDDQGVFNVASERRDTDDALDGADEYTLKASSSKVLLNDFLVDGSKDHAGEPGIDLSEYDVNCNNNTIDGKDKDGDVADPVFGTAGYDTALTSNVFVDDSGIKVIYLTIGDDGEVDSIEIKDGMQSINNDEILGKDSNFANRVRRAQACVSLKDVKDANGKVVYTNKVTEDSVVKAIVVKLESSSANLTDLVYISKYLSSAGKAPGADNTQRPVYGYEVHFVGKDGWEDEVTIYSFQKLDKGDFARSRKPASFPEGVKNVTEDNFYTLTGYGTVNNEKTGKALSVLRSARIASLESNNKTLMHLTNCTPAGEFLKAWPTNDVDGDLVLDLGDENVGGILSLRGAHIIDLSENEIQSASDLKDVLKELANDGKTLTVQALYNDDTDSDGFRDVYVLVITGEYTYPNNTTPPAAADLSLTAKDAAGNAVSLASLKGKTSGEYTLTAEVTNPKDGTKYTFQWKKGTEVVAATTTENTKSTYVVTLPAGADVVYTCEVKAKHGSDVETDFVSVGSADFTAVQATDLQKDQIKVTLPTSMEKGKTTKITVTPPVDANGNAVPNVKYILRVGDKVYVSNASNTAFEGVEVTDELISGTNVTLQVLTDVESVTPSQDGTSVTVTPVDGDPTEIAATEVEQTPDVEEVPVPEEDQVVGADNVTVTLDLSAKVGNKTVADYLLVEDADGNFITDTKIVMPKGRLTLTFTQDGTLPDGVALQNVTVKGTPVAFEDGAATIEGVAITADTTVTVSVIDYNAEVAKVAVSDSSYTATGILADGTPASEGFSSWTKIESVADGYTVTMSAGSAANEVTATLAGTVKLHFAGADGFSKPAYWYGVGIPTELTAAGKAFKLVKYERPDRDPVGDGSEAISASAGATKSKMLYSTILPNLPDFTWDDEEYVPYSQITAHYKADSTGETATVVFNVVAGANYKAADFVQATYGETNWGLLNPTTPAPDPTNPDEGA